MTCICLFHRYALALASLAMLSAILTPKAVAQRPLLTLEDLLRVWKERENATRSLRFEMAGHYRDMRDAFAGPEAPEYSETNQRCVVVIDGTTMRYERTVAAAWHNAVKAMLPITVTAVSNGDCEKVLLLRDRSDDVVYSEGFIRDGKRRHPDAQNLFLSPIIRHFRPLSTAFFVIRAGDLRVIDQDSVVGGLRCLVLEESQGEGQRVRKHWIAPEQGMAIVRSTGYVRNKMEHQMEVSFKQDAMKNWIPDHWKVVLFTGKGTVASSVANKVTISDVNSVVPPATFDIAFPPGTHVYDKVSNASYVVKPYSSHR